VKTNETRRRATRSSVVGRKKNKIMRRVELWKKGKKKVKNKYREGIYWEK